MTIRKKIFLWVVLWLIALLIVRIIGTFLPPAVALLIWLLFLVPLLLLGAILAIALLLIIVICLGRISYRIDASIGADKEAYVEVSYLLRLVHFVLVYRDGKLESRTRIAWLRPGSEKPGKKKRKVNDVNLKKDTQDIKDTSTKSNRSKADTVASDHVSNDTRHIGNTTTKSKPILDKEKSPPPELEKEAKDRLKPFKQVKAVLTYPDRKIIIGLCFQCLQKFIKALKPRMLEVSGVIGFEDPCTTGWVMGAYEAAAGIMQLRHNVRLIGNYTEKVLELDIKAEGRTRMWSLLWPFLWLYLHKPIRVVLHKYILRKEDLDE